VEPLGPARLVTVEPAGDLGSLLAIHGDQREALGHSLFLDMEEGLAVDRRQEHGEEPCRFEVPQDGDRRIAGGHVFPDPQDGDRARPPRNGLDLPGSGELRLGSGQAVVAFAEEGQVGREKALSKGETGVLLPSRELRMRFCLLRG
jgi:hypothetical protein